MTRTGRKEAFGQGLLLILWDLKLCKDIQDMYAMATWLAMAIYSGYRLTRTCTCTGSPLATSIPNAAHRLTKGPSHTGFGRVEIRSVKL